MITHMTARANGERVYATRGPGEVRMRGVMEFETTVIADQPAEFSARAYPGQELEAVAAMRRFAEDLGSGYALVVRFEVTVDAGL